MPIYEYRCENGHQFEVMQSMSADPLTACEVCDAPVQRVFHPVAVHFKGSGFYSTDYGRGKTRRDGDSPASADKPSEKPVEKAASEKSGSEKPKPSGESS